MTTDRPYSLAISLRRARAEIAAKSGTQFDPAVVAELVRFPTRRWSASDTMA